MTSDQYTRIKADWRWRERVFGKFTGVADVRHVRNECRYPWARHTWLTRMIWERFLPRVIYLYEPDKQEPLTYHHPDGTKFRLGRMETDMGSIPPFAQWLVQKDVFLFAFLFHDFCYDLNGLFARNIQRDVPTDADAWIPVDAQVPRDDWHFVEFSRGQADNMLSCMIGAQGGLLPQRLIVGGAVTIGGWSVWKKRKGEKPAVPKEWNA